MTCPVCGSAEPARDGRCLACGTPDGGATVYPNDDGRTLLPAGDGQTILPGGNGRTTAPVDEGGTILPTAGRAAAPPPDDGATVLPGAQVPVRKPEPGPHGPLAVGQDFGSRYHIFKELGVGGMGAVYQAWDAELGVAVALKVIRPEALKDPREAQELERRFKRELLLARQVTHKGVVRIHDLGEIHGIKYITMSFVDGEDLSTVLRREGRLPIGRVLAIAREVVSGMQAAHEAGVVHRDLKPANIMIDHEDHALIMDFGIALSSDKAAKDKPGAPAPANAPLLPPPAEIDATATMMGATPGPAAGAAADEGATVMGAISPPTAASMMKASRSGTILSTKSGGIVGTLEYMAPEQSKGQPVDQRSDIYAFGLILSDLILGQRKVPEGSSPWKELTTRVSQPPAPLRSKAPRLPEDIDALVTKCIQLDPAERFQTTADLAAALNRLDDQGNLIPEPKIKRFTPRIAAVAALVVSMLVGATYWLARGPAAPPKPPDPVSVLIADFKNNAQDPVFDGLLEQALAVGVEGASFVNAYPRGDALKLATQLKPGGRLDDDAAALVALREGVDRVMGGAIDKAGNGYTLSLRIVNPADRKTLLAWATTASGKDEVLGAVGKMAARAREALGDRSASADKVKNEETFTAASLEAARAYTTGQELQWAGKYDDAYAQYQQAVKLDPDMGRAYAGLGAVAYSLGRQQESEESYRQALQRLGRMTDREKYRTRGGSFLLTRNIDKAREQFQALVKQAPTDSAGLSNLALTEFYARDMTKAVQLGMQASKVFPKAVFYKNNAALYAMYAGDFAAAQKEAAEVLAINPTHPKAHLATAVSQLATDHAADAAATYAKMQGLPGSAKWLAANGLADLAMYEGRLADAAALLDPAIKLEENVSRKARLVVTLAEVRGLQGRPRDGIALARQAMEISKSAGIAFLAGRALNEAGQTAPALEVVTRLLQRFDGESLAMARVLEGEIALKVKDPRKAIERFKTAQQFADSWLGRFGLGRAYLAVGAIPEADSEFDLCLKRRGEATAALLDDVPTYRLFAPIYYYQGRVHDELGSPGAKDSYAAYLAIKQHADEQGLVADARKRLAAAR